MPIQDVMVSVDRVVDTHTPTGVCMKGTVKWFDDVNGVGFIVPDTAGEDAFVHWTSIVVDGFKSLAEGQRVEYDTAVSAYGPTAKNVKILDE